MSRSRELQDPQRLAWLLREDLRQGQEPTAPLTDWFRCWWVVNGRREYPGWADAGDVHALNLLEPLPDWPCHGLFGMTPALRFLFQQRPDLRKHFDIRTEQGLWHAIAWFFVHGLREHGLQDLVDARVREALDETPPFLHWPLRQTAQPQSITWLMFFVWRCYPELQKAFDLRTASGQLDFLEWFFLQGVARLGLAPLLAERWSDWLRRPLPVKGRNGVAMPRALLLLAQQRPALQRALRLCPPADAQAWALRQLGAEKQLQWLAETVVPREPVARRLSARRRPWGVNLIGFAFGELGIGEDVRMAVEACKAAGIPFKVVNIHPGNALRQGDQALAEQTAAQAADDEEAPYAINLFCLTAFDTARVYLERGKVFFDGHYNIGWWPWELPVWPRHWHGVFSLVDEVWAATRFTERMYEDGVRAAKAPTRVTWMPLPASVARVQPVQRARLGLPPRRFLFLYVFDFNSYLARKNPFAAIEAFKLAYPSGKEPVGLVLKTMNSRQDNPEWARFVSACLSDTRITLLDKTLDRGEVLGLIGACEACLSLHRSEGFGRTLAEAMLLGKPVVGTDFSGNVDFLTEQTGFPVRWSRRCVQPGEYPFITEADGAWWAEPDVRHAAQQMLAAQQAVQAGKVYAERVMAHAVQQFSPARIGQLMRARMERVSHLE